jgi:hypothetical protein
MSEQADLLPARNPADFCVVIMGFRVAMSLPRQEATSAGGQ